MNVDYSIGTADLSCKDLESVGTVRDKGKNVLLPWIVKLTEKVNRVPDQIEKLVPAEQAVQVSGRGSWLDSNSKGHCGPVIVSFVPAAQRTYLVEFVWQSSSRCTSQVFDVTDPVERVPVQTVSKSCERSFIDVWLGR
jgi:hypothetical protein